MLQFDKEDGYQIITAAFVSKLKLYLSLFPAGKIIDFDISNVFIIDNVVENLPGKIINLVDYTKGKISVKEEDVRNHIEPTFKRNDFVHSTAVGQSPAFFGFIVKKLNDDSKDYEVANIKTGKNYIRTENELTIERKVVQN
jgi:hypothetical protein